MEALGRHNSLAWQIRAWPLAPNCLCLNLNFATYQLEDFGQSTKLLYTSVSSSINWENTVPPSHE